MRYLITGGAGFIGSNFVKIFPFKGDIGQPYTVDSSFSRKEIHKDENNEEFVKMKPVYKKLIPKERFDELSKKFIQLLSE